MRGFESAVSFFVFRGTIGLLRTVASANRESDHTIWGSNLAFSSPFNFVGPLHPSSGFAKIRKGKPTAESESVNL